MTRRALVVCTANVCRSPVAAALLQRRVGDRPDAAGHPWVVRSAGTSLVRAAMDPRTVEAAAAVGVDIGDHVARHLDRELLTIDGADLVIVMTREHLRAVIGIDPGAWPRAFTLKELARRVSTTRPYEEGEQLPAWLARVAAGRQTREMMVPSPDDDIADPYGKSRQAHVAMVDEVMSAVAEITSRPPWGRRPE